MAQNGPHGHQDVAASEDGRSAPPTTVTFSPTSAGSYGNGGSSAGNMDAGGKGKNLLIPDLNMEENDSAGDSKNKPRSEAEVEVAAADADADKGKSVAMIEDGEVNVNIIIERERRKRMKDLFTSLQDLMPHVPQKTDKVTLVGEAIHYIKFLEEKAAMLGKQKLEQALARQAAARGEASSSSSSFPLTAMPQTAEGMAPLSSPGVPRGWGGVPVLPTAPAVPASPIRFKTWSGQNVVLTVANNNAYISVCAPKRPNTLSTVMSVLDNHGIDVITVQISSDRVRSLFLIFAQVTGIDGVTHSSEEVFQRAVWEIMIWLNSNN